MPPTSGVPVLGASRTRLRGASRTRLGASRTRLRGASAALLSLFLGCSAPELVVVTELPADADRLALLAESPAGAHVFSTPVRPTTPGSPPRIEDVGVDLEGSVLFVLGWRSADLAGLPVEEAPLRRARPGEPSLPSPTFAVRGTVAGDPLTPVAVRADELPSLTSASLMSCPARVPPGALIDSNCSSTACFPALSQTGCALDLDMVSCRLGAARGRIDSAGAASLDDNGQLGACVEVPAPPGTALALECTRPGRDACRVDAIAPDAARAPFGAVDRVALVDVPTSTAPPSLHTVMAGHLGAMVALDDRVLVVGTPRPVSVWCVDAPSTLYRVDAETLAVDSSTTTYRCLTAMVRDPIGDGVVIASGGPQAVQLARLDRDGRLRARWPLDTGGLAVTRLAASAELIFAALSRPDRDGGHVVAVRARTGEVVWRTRPGIDRLVDLVSFDDEIVAIDEAAGSAVAHGHDGGFRLQVPLGLPCGIQGADPVRVWPFRRPNRWVITSIRDGAEVLVLTEARDRGCTSAGTYMSPEAEPHALAPWPGDDPERLMIGLWTQAGDAALARYDARAHRFEPGLLPLGRGWVGELGSITTPSATYVFAALPLTGELVRIRP